MSVSARPAIQDVALFVTGASGFLGREVLRVLRRDRPTHTVVGLTRRALAVATDQSLVLGDLMDRAAVATAIPPNATIVHLAYSDQPAKNEGALANVIAAAADRGAKRIIHCSTALVAGKASADVITEDVICQPATPYEIEKFALERQVIEESPATIEVVILRPTAILGPGGLNLASMAERLTRGRPVINAARCAIFGDRRMNLVGVENVAKAILFLAERAADRNRDIFIVADDGDPANRYASVQRLLATALRVPPSCSALTLPAPALDPVLALLGKAPANRIYSSGKLRAAGFVFTEPLESAIQRFGEHFSATRARN